MSRFVNKRGQLTLFIIAGIIVLIILGIFFFMRLRTVEKAVPEEIVPEEFSPVKVFIEDCIKQVGERAVKIIGEQGGYIDPEAEGIRFEEQNPTEGTGLFFTSLVPYWFYLASDNDCSGDCRFGSFMPFLYKEQGEPSIQAQIEQYVKDNLEECLGGFRAVEQYDVTALPGFKAESSINPDNIVLNIEYPVKISLGDVEAEIKHFSAAIDVSLPKVYYASAQMMDAERDHCVLEHEAIELITAFSALDKDKLPPQIAVKAGSAPVIWLERDVKQKVEDMLQAYIPLLRLRNALNYKDIKTKEGVQYSEVVNTFYDNMVLPFDARGLNVDFTYLSEWPIYFSLGKGFAVRPTTVSVPFLGFAIQKYSVGYDVSYPVIVEFNDPEAFGGKGYSFKIALEGNMRNNLCMENNFKAVDFGTAGSTSMLCDYDKRNSGLYNISLKDDQGNPIGAAFITFTSDDSCPIAETDEQGNFAGKLPVGMGALMIDHPEFLSFVQPIRTEVEKGDVLEFELPRKRKVDFIVLKKNYRKQPGWAFNNFELPLNFEETAVLSLRRVPQGNEEEYFTSAVYTGNNSAFSTSESLELFPGTYDVTIDLFADDTDNPLVIPPDKRKVSGGWFSGDEEVWVPAEPMVMTSWQSGGVKLDLNTGRWKVSGDQLDRADKIIFYVIGFEKPYINKIEDLGMPSRIGEFSSQHRSLLEPKVIEE